MEILGKPTIHPALFFSGKVCGYAAWLLYFGSFLGWRFAPAASDPVPRAISYLLCGFGLALLVLSSIGLGASTRLGIPRQRTKLKTGGIYKISRNPMYLGFDALTAASMLGTLNPMVALVGAYSAVVYHLIIRGEEKYLERQFGEAYRNYRDKVRRYL